ncbi:hypothetical protein FRB95_001891 [Tulasnella sp. JGI-2019a]|nr:hypothetical protein FRB95_001891 [Tulasnella sp. JGI-2019a]
MGLHTDVSDDSSSTSTRYKHCIIAIQYRTCVREVCETYIVFPVQTFSIRCAASSWIRQTAAYRPHPSLQPSSAERGSLRLQSVSYACRTDFGTIYWKERSNQSKQSLPANLASKTVIA